MEQDNRVEFMKHWGYQTLLINFNLSITLSLFLQSETEGWAR